MKDSRTDLQKITDRQSLREWSCVVAVWVGAGALLYYLFVISVK